MSSPLNRRTQIAFVAEEQEGVAQALAAANLLPALVAPDGSYDLAGIERNLARGTLTNPEAVPSFRSGKVKFRMELAGPKSGAVLTNLPAFDAPLRACGMRGVGLKKVTLPATWTSGTVIKDGDRFTTSGGATPSGRVWGDVQVGDSHLFYEAYSGTVAAGEVMTFKDGADDVTTVAVLTLAGGATFEDVIGYRPADYMLSKQQVTTAAGITLANGQVLVGATSGARGRFKSRTSIPPATLGNMVFERFNGSAHFVATELIKDAAGVTLATASAAPGGTEVQRENVSGTIGIYHDGTILKQFKGSRGTFKITLKNGDRGLIDFDFMGCGIEPIDSALLVWPDDPNAIPPVVTGGLFTIDKTYLPAFTQLELDIGNELLLREMPSDSTGCGYESCVITGRNPKGSIDPETIARAIYDAQDKAWAKGTFRLVARIGTAVGNRIEVRCRKTQIDAMTEQDSSGLLRSNMPLLLRGTPIYGLSSGSFFDPTFGGDELILFVY